MYEEDNEGLLHDPSNKLVKYPEYVPARERVGLKEEITGMGSLGFDQIVTKDEAFQFWGLQQQEET